MPRDGVGFSFGYGVDARVQAAVEVLNTADGWYPAIESSGAIRDGAWVAEATDLVDMGSWPAGTRLILRKERPHPGAQLRFTDSDGLRVTAFITDTPPPAHSTQAPKKPAKSFLEETSTRWCSSCARPTTRPKRGASSTQ